MPLDEQGGRGVPQRMRRNNECAETRCARETGKPRRVYRGPAHKRNVLKTGYDPEFSKNSPGRVLRKKVLCGLYLPWGAG